MDKLNGCIFLIEGDDLLEKYNTIWDKVSADLKKECNKKQNLMVIDIIPNLILQLLIFTIRTFLRWILIIIVSQLSAWILLFKKDENYFLKVLLKEFKYIKEKVIRYINDKLRNCSYSDESDEE